MADSKGCERILQLLLDSIKDPHCYSHYATLYVLIRAAIARHEGVYAVAR